MTTDDVNNGKWIKKLLDHHETDLSIKDKNGKTALQLSINIQKYIFKETIEVHLMKQIIQNQESTNLTFNSVYSDKEIRRYRFNYIFDDQFDSRRIIGPSGVFIKSLMKFYNVYIHIRKTEPHGYVSIYF
jgi:hypothetical protein